MFEQVGSWRTVDRELHFLVAIKEICVDVDVFVVHALTAIFRLQMLQNKYLYNTVFYCLVSNWDTHWQSGFSVNKVLNTGQFQADITDKPINLFYWHSHKLTRADRSVRCSFGQYLRADTDKNILISTSMSDSAAGVSEKKKLRRSRKDCPERTFACKHCDKTYLSNAALYTHVKTKHAMQTHGLKQKILEQSEDFNAEKRQVSEPEQKHVFPLVLEKLHYELSKYFPGKHDFSNFEEAFDGSTSSARLFRFWFRFWEEHGKLPTEKERVSIDSAISYFLFLIGQKISLNCIRYLMEFFHQFRIGLQRFKKSAQVCETESCLNLPTYFNDLIMNKHMSPITNPNQNKQQSEEALMMQILEGFGNWLYHQQLTDYRLVSNY